MLPVEFQKKIILRIHRRTPLGFLNITANLVQPLGQPQRTYNMYIKKQDIRTQVLYSLPNGWTEWAEFFLDTHGQPEGNIG